MERSKIVEGIYDLVDTTTDPEIDAEVIWEDRAPGGIEFTVSIGKMALGKEKQMFEAIIMHVTGHPVQRLRVIGEFTEVLGTGALKDADFNDYHHRDVIAWPISNPDIDEAFREPRKAC